MSQRSDLDLTQSTRRASAITPSDATVFKATNGLYVGGAGTIRVMHEGDIVVTNYPVTVAGYIYPWSITQVHQAGTTATSLVAQYGPKI